MISSLMSSAKSARSEDLVFKLLTPQKTTADLDHSHSVWTSALSEFVMKRGAQSRVRYEAIRSNPKNIQQYLDGIGTVTEREFAAFSDAQRIAFLINAYNAYTVALIVNNYPVQSIKKIGGWFASPWKIQFFRLRGQLHALDDIEHTMLRKDFNEPRIHFALVCAAVSCPALRNEAYVADRLNTQLDDAADSFLSDAERNRFDPSTKILHLSSIFKWYGDDFNPKFGSAANFAISRMKRLKLIPEAVPPSSISIEYLPYDWSLNDSK